MIPLKTIILDAIDATQIKLTALNTRNYIPQGTEDLKIIFTGNDLQFFDGNYGLILPQGHQFFVASPNLFDTPHNVICKVQYSPLQSLYPVSGLLAGNSYFIRAYAYDRIRFYSTFDDARYEQNALYIARTTIVNSKLHLLKISSVYNNIPIIGYNFKLNMEPDLIVPDGYKVKMVLRKFTYKPLYSTFKYNKIGELYIKYVNNSHYYNGNVNNVNNDVLLMTNNFSNSISYINNDDDYCVILDKLHIENGLVFYLNEKKYDVNGNIVEGCTTVESDFQITLNLYLVPDTYKPPKILVLNSDNAIKTISGTTTITNRLEDESKRRYFFPRDGGVDLVNNLIICNGHGFSEGDKILFNFTPIYSKHGGNFTSMMPSPLRADRTIYYVKFYDVNRFGVSLTAGGAYVDLISQISGTDTALYQYAYPVQNDNYNIVSEYRYKFPLQINDKYNNNNSGTIRVKHFSRIKNVITRDLLKDSATKKSGYIHIKNIPNTNDIYDYGNDKISEGIILSSYDLAEENININHNKKKNNNNILSYRSDSDLVIKIVSNDTDDNNNIINGEIENNHHIMTLLLYDD